MFAKKFKSLKQLLENIRPVMLTSSGSLAKRCSQWPRRTSSNQERKTSRQTVFALD